MKVLLVEDEIDFQRLLADYLKLSGYEVVTANNGIEGLDKFREEHFDLCILDILMPEMDGFSLAEQIKKMDNEMPFIFLTAKDQKEDKLRGLKLGADDYITKPFDAEELVLRIGNILRRQQSEPGENRSLGDLELNMDELKLRTSSQEHQLTIREAELIGYLMLNVNKVVSREQVLRDLWGKNDFFLGRSMDVFISRIRKYLQDVKDIELETIRGVGFVLKTPFD